MIAQFYCIHVSHCNIFLQYKNRPFQANREYLHKRSFAQQGGGHEETRNPFASIPRGAVRSADRSDGDRPALHVLARGAGADPATAPGRQSVGVCGASCVFEISQAACLASDEMPTIRHACLHSRSDSGSRPGVFDEYASETKRAGSISANSRHTLTFGLSTGGLSSRRQCGT